MKAIVNPRYGSPDVLQLVDVPKPDPAENLVLVRVRAASVNPADWHMMRGEPYVMRVSGNGLTKPKLHGIGHDFAGTVETVGSKVTRFRPGDEVFGASVKTFAEYVRVSEQGLARKPGNLSFEEAAACGVAGLTALQGLRDHAKVTSGEKVLINGASGGVGTFAVQMAKAWSAVVTGVCSSRNIELVRSLGADEVIDYTREDFCRRGDTYDVIYDAVGNRRIGDMTRALTKQGRLVLIGPGKGRWVRAMMPMVLAPLRSRFSSRTIVWFLSKRNPEDLEILREMLDSGKVRPVIDRTYPLDQASEAVRYLETGHAQGKVVVTI